MWDMIFGVEFLEGVFILFFGIVNYFGIFVGRKGFGYGGFDG